MNTKKPLLMLLCCIGLSFSVLQVHEYIGISGHDDSNIDKTLITFVFPEFYSTNRADQGSIVQYEQQFCGYPEFLIVTECNSIKQFCYNYPEPVTDFLQKNILY